MRTGNLHTFHDPSDEKFYFICTSIGQHERNSCPAGMVFEKDIRICLPNSWAGWSITMSNGICIMDKSLNAFKCNCKKGFEGLYCQTNIDECVLEGNKVCPGKYSQTKKIQIIYLIDIKLTNNKANVWTKSTATTV